jgi:hypothetical protein
MRKAREFLPDAITMAIEDGIAPHDRDAVGLFREFLQELVSQDEVWSKCKTWLVDTGDLTSLGDQNSLNMGAQILNDLAKVCPNFVSIYGNHDAWAGKLPIWTAQSAVASKKKALAKLKYSIDTPMLALQADIPNGGAIQLYALDSIAHNWWLNLRAIGEVSEEQLEAFATLVDANYTGGQPQFRILAVHHPVHYPPPRPSLQMSLSNDERVANFLHTQSPKGAYPLAHLVISGHTHFLYPQHGSLPSQPSLCAHPHLGDEQCQFVVGSLMQLDTHHKRAGWPHQCEILRLYYSPSDPSVLLMERLLAARQAGPNYRATGLGPYRFVQLSKSVGEEITFTV